jgi:phosphatidate cytidylyltransferase
MSEKAPARSNLALRLLTAAVTVPLILYTLFLGPHWAFPALTGFVCSLGAIELFAMVAPEHRALRIWGLLASLAVYVTFVIGPTPEQQTGMTLGLVGGGMLVSLIRVEPIGAASNRMGWAIAGPLYMGALFGTIALLFQQRHGGEWAVLAMLAGFWSDTGGYFVGRAYGKHKLYEAVSPKKTIEGSIGGAAAALIGGLIAHFWFLPSLPLFDAIVLSILAALAGQAGDLCESLIKRSHAVKDSGTILPGHGGILDRVDALLFSAIVVWAYVVLFTK